MTLILDDKVMAEVRTVWQYDSEVATVDEIIEYFDTNYGISMRAQALWDGAGVCLVFQSCSGSTAHYMQTGDYLVIDQHTCEYDVISEQEHDERVELAESLIS